MIVSVSIFKNVTIFTLIISSIVSLSGCSDCTNTQVSSVQRGQWTAKLEHRACGSYSGFTVSIFQTNDGPPKSGEGINESFQAAIRSNTPYEFDRPPISIAWTKDSNLLIQHDTRMSISDSESKLLVFKAQNQYKDIAITYDPKPVIWEQQ